MPPMTTPTPSTSSLAGGLRARLNGQALKPIHDWVKSYERSWSERFDELDDVLEDSPRSTCASAAGGAT